MSVAPCMIAHMAHESPDTLRELARRHLPVEVAERWLGLSRPAVGLAVAADSDPPAGHLGGLPRLPAAVDWPVWDGHGPLSFVASIDCATLPADAVDIALPSDGTLLFFYFDGQVDGGVDVVMAEDRDSWAGARLLFVRADQPVAERDVPTGLTAYPRVPLTARPVITTADPGHPRLRAAFGMDARSDLLPDHPVFAKEFLDALAESDGAPGHRIGGYADPVQISVEYEVAKGVLGPQVPWDDPRVPDEAAGWVLLAQFESDDTADMMWGDCGALYWLIRPHDLAERRFDRAMFTWQCG